MIYKIFGIKFFDINFNQVIKLNKKGLVVFPAAPALCDINENKIYHKSLKNADVALFDSGYFVLLLKIFKGLNISKFSGYKFLKNFFKHNKNKKIFSVETDKKYALINSNFLKKFKIKSQNLQYIAPLYLRNKLIKDTILLEILKKKKPNIIIINLGGGIQEVLGSYLKDNLNYHPLIICTGAAISFFTKQQAPINSFIDKLYLGWLVRCIFKPKQFIPRYLKSFKLVIKVMNSEIKTIKI
jgi:UDP-N-acetyl-D-mannosaminuronic acid transferase (WecB/TagA/CpsF family)